jgi:YcxB-like protein
MRIVYENTLEDIAAFSRYHYDNSPAIRRLRLYLLGIALVAGALCSVAVLRLLGGDTLATWLSATLAATIVGIMLVAVPKRWSSWFWNSYGRRYIARAYSEGRNRALFGRHELQFSEDGVSERTEVGELNLRWSAIERIQCTDDYTFIYVSAVSALVLPRARVTEGDYGGFIADLERRWTMGCRSSGESGMEKA